MIDFRYHVVSIVAVFLAIALGLFIGSTTLRGTVATDLNRRTAAVRSENANLSAQVHDLKNQLNDADAFDTALEPSVLHDALAGDSVVVVSAPGVDAGSRTNLVNAIAAAGGTVTGDVRLQDALLDPDQRTFLETLTARLTVPGHPATGGDGSQRAMRLLADVLGIRPQSIPVPAAAAAKVLAGFT
ncbi:MAG TPA: copper transporter, partial [Mycobacteriales bacterium]|nr:copper transporter [Mycobacteriales bacterium]